VDDAVRTSSAGAAQLADGLRLAGTTIGTLPARFGDLASGATDANVGAQAAMRASAAIAAGAGGLASAASQAHEGGVALTRALTQLSGHTPDLVQGSATISAGLTGLVNAWDSLTDEQRRATVTALAGAAASTSEGAEEVNGTLSDLAASASGLMGSVDGTGLPGLAAAASSLADAAAASAAGMRTLADGTERLETGTAQITGQASSLVTAVERLTAAATDLRTGLDSVAAGSTELVAGADRLVAGSNEIAAGAGELDDGIVQMAGASATLASGLEEAAQELPHLDEAEAHRLAEVAARPVRLDTERVNGVPGYGYGLAPYFMSLALWVGGLAFYVVKPALRSGARLRPEGSERSWQEALRCFLPGAVLAVVQAVAMVLLVCYALGVAAVNPLGLVLYSALGALAFVAINQGLVALMGLTGRFVALALFMLQIGAAGGVYPIETEPSFLRAIHGWMPLTYLMKSLRSLIAGGSHGQSSAPVVLAVWLLFGLVMTTLAIHVQRIRRLSAIAVGETDGSGG
jgi:putative membrane protein